MSEDGHRATTTEARRLVAGRYEIIRELGRGGMGAVFEARHTWTGRRVALKTLLGGMADDPLTIERFRREARAGVQGAHPHIAEVLDMGVDPVDGSVYLAMEFLPGEDLARRLARERTLSPDEALRLLVPAMLALDAAHRVGVLHRDIKPANLFVSTLPDGQARLKVIDFGIANLADSAPVTLSGAPIGTPQYMAPEQARGERDLDARVDVWSMGVVCFEALSGKRPFDGVRYHEVLGKVISARRPSLLDADPTLEPALCAVIDAALEPERHLRIPSMAEFARRLASLPAFEGAPWAGALRAAELDATPAAPREAPFGPTTLDLPPEPGASPEARPAPRNPAPETLDEAAAAPRVVTDAPLVSRALRARRAGRSGWFAAALSLAVAGGLVLLARSRDAAPPRAARSPTPTSPRPTPPAALDPAPAAVAEAPRDLPAARPPDGLAVAARTAPREAAPRRLARIAAPRRAPARADDPSSQTTTNVRAVNGAPVLEP